MSGARASVVPKVSELPESASIQARRHFPLTDLGNAERFAFRNAEFTVRYVHGVGWFLYDGIRWALDVTRKVDRYAAETVRSIYAEALEVSRTTPRSVGEARCSKRKSGAHRGAAKVGAVDGRYLHFRPRTRLRPTSSQR